MFCCLLSRVIEYEELLCGKQDPDYYSVVALTVRINSLLFIYFMRWFPIEREGKCVNHFSQTQTITPRVKRGVEPRFWF